MSDIADLLEKLERSAASERAIGNFGAAEAFEAKAGKLRRKHNLKRAEAVKEPAQDLREAFTKWLDSIPLEAEVVVDDPCGGMQRQMPLEAVVSRIKSGELLLLKTVDAKYAWQGGTKEHRFFVQEVAEPKDEQSRLLFI